VSKSKRASQRQSRRKENLIDFFQEEERLPQIKKSFNVKDIKHVHPLTENQVVAFDAWDQGKHVFLGGSAGTGKSFQPSLRCFGGFPRCSGRR